MPLRVMGLIPARGGSKGIAGKNLAPLNGRPLVAWTVEAARGSRLDRVVVSSDDPDIIRAATADGTVEAPFVRPPELAADETPAIDVVLHAVSWMADQGGYRPDAVMLLQPTSPLRTRRHIDEAIDTFERTGADSLVSVVRTPHAMVPESVMRVDTSGWLQPYVALDDRANLRQRKPVYYARNGAAIYLVRRDVLLQRRSLYGERIAPYVMDREESVDIDERFDLELAAWLMARRETAAGGA
jgi:CMP-N,N'-diacetyllegionaminic acid synthase